jgi:hypothetical protein
MDRRYFDRCGGTRDGACARERRRAMACQPYQRGSPACMMGAEVNLCESRSLLSAAGLARSVFFRRSGKRGDGTRRRSKRPTRSANLIATDTTGPPLPMSSD